MKSRTAILFFIFSAGVGGFLLASHGLAASTQVELDTACEEAREARLAPMRAEFIEECVERVESGRRSRNVRRNAQAYCESFYADFGDRSGNRAPLFLDLPECEAAFENQRSHRRR